MDGWNANGDAGGGYFNENGFGTPTTESKSKPAARQQFLCPVTIRQLLEAPEEGLKVGVFTATMVTFVGVVVNVEVTATNIKFVMSDDTGVIDCMDWIETEDSGEPKKTLNIMENSYYQVFGCIKTPQGRRRIMVFKVAPIVDFNDVTAFMAEVLSVNQYAQKLNQAPETPMETNQSSSMVTFGGRGGFEDPKNTFTPVQRAVLEAVKKVEDQIGWNRSDATLKNKFPARLIQDAIEFLVGEGHIYSTVDDDHFSYT